MPSADNMSDPEEKVLTCWRQSADHWQHLIAQQRLSSREVTNPAIEKATLALQPASVLDVGCGEGWLARRLANHGIQVTGTDAVASLVEYARQQDKRSDYHCLEYSALPGPLAGQYFDVAVCNFSLFGDESVRQLLATIANELLVPGGHLLIQTLHPFSASLGNYHEGWRDSQWQGLDQHGKTLGEAPPWFFRSLAGWFRLLGPTGNVTNIEEPLDPETRLPLSILFQLQIPPKQDDNKP